MFQIDVKITEIVYKQYFTWGRFLG